MPISINLTVQIGNNVKTVHFLIVDKPVSAVILGFEYCDKHFEDIKPQLRIVEIDKWSTVVSYDSPRRLSLKCCSRKNSSLKKAVPDVP